MGARAQLLQTKGEIHPWEVTSTQSWWQTSTHGTETNMEPTWKPEHLKRNTDSTVSNTKTQTHNLFPSHKQYFKTNSLLEADATLRNLQPHTELIWLFFSGTSGRHLSGPAVNEKCLQQAEEKKKLPDFEPLSGCKSAGRKGVLIIQHVKNQISRLQTKAGEH